MHPAYSIIVFTTVSGLGYGLAFVLGLGFLDSTLLATKLAYLVSLALISAGLLSSLLHLGNPQRAWRAVSQWRSSWLSREGVMALGTFVPLTLGAALCVLWGRQSWLLGLITAVGALTTVYCTSMIYASLRSVQSWHTGLTSICFLLFSLAGGFLLASLFDPGSSAIKLLALILLLAATAAKVKWRTRAMSDASLSTPETATGLGSIGKVALFERPHALDNYLTREMGYRVARKHASKLWRIALLFGAAAPILALVITLATGPSAFVPLLLALAIAAHMLGMFVERWLFFAEARHAVMNYY